MVAFPQPQQTLGQLFGGQLPQQQQPAQQPQMGGGLPADPQTLGQLFSGSPKPKLEWWKIAGLIGDALQTAGGGRPTFAPMIAEQTRAEREREQREYEAGMRRLGDRQDFMFEQDYRAKNPGPTEMERTIDYLKQAYPDQVGEYVRHKVNPPLYRQGPDGQFYPVAPPPTRPVGKLTPMTGDAGSNAGGGFR